MSSQPEPVKFPPSPVAYDTGPEMRALATATWRVRVDAARCIGSGICVGTAPGRFAFVDGQQSMAVSELVDASEVMRDIAAACPVEAISITDAETGAPVSLA